MANLPAALSVIPALLLSAAVAEAAVLEIDGAYGNGPGCKVLKGQALPAGEGLLYLAITPQFFAKFGLTCTFRKISRTGGTTLIDAQCHDSLRDTKTKAKLRLKKTNKGYLLSGPPRFTEKLGRCI